MTLYYSALDSGFFDDTIHQSLPPDARPVSAETHSSLLAQQEQGRRIVADANGDPIAVDPPAPTLDEQMARLRSERDRRLRASDYTQMADYPMDETARLAWASYRQALRDLPETTTDLAAVAWPEPPVT